MIHAVLYSLALFSYFICHGLPPKSEMVIGGRCLGLDSLPMATVSFGCCFGFLVLQAKSFERMQSRNPAMGSGWFLGFWSWFLHCFQAKLIATLVLSCIGHNYLSSTIKFSLPNVFYMTTLTPFFFFFNWISNYIHELCFVFSLINSFISNY